jgi:hypothetical protein
MDVDAIHQGYLREQQCITANPPVSNINDADVPF